MTRVKMKIVLLGEGRVGKTSLLQRFVHDRFDEDCTSTQRASMYANVRLPIDRTAPSSMAGGKPSLFGNSSPGAAVSSSFRGGGTGDDIADVSIWDTAGQERYHALGPIYYRDAHGAVLVYDITDIESFEKVKVWLKELHAVVGEEIAVAVVGNKADLERERKVPKKAAEEWAAQQGARHFTVSAKLGIHVAEPFYAVATSVFESEVEASGSGNAIGGMGLTKSSSSSATAVGGRTFSSKSPTDRPGSFSYHTTSAGGGASRSGGGVGGLPQRSRGVKVSLVVENGGVNTSASDGEDKKSCAC